MAVRKRLDDLLARADERVQVRLHQAANRLEDADPVDVGIARVGARVLGAVDRLTGFRERHRSTRTFPEGERRPVPPPTGTRRPELAGLDPDRLTAMRRARLRERYRMWQRRLEAEGARIATSDLPTGGAAVSEATARELEPLWTAWREELAIATREGGH